MKISKLSLRGRTYSYRSRVPEHHKARYASNGNNPEKVVQLSLKTSDPSIALARAKIIDSWIENGGVGIVDFVPAREHYLQQLAIYGNMPKDIRPAHNGNPFTGNPEDWRKDPTTSIDEGKPPLLDPDISDALRLGEIDKSELTQQQMAASAVERGLPTLDIYKYSMRNALSDFRVLQQGEIQEKTLAAYDHAVALFLGDKSDVALDAIKSSDVALWIDGLKIQTAQSTRRDHVNRLAKLFKYARTRARCAERINPFENHELGKPDAQNVQPMSDSELLTIIPSLASDKDRAWAVLARYHGMRMAELAFSEIVTYEDVVCFNITEVEVGQWRPKTDAGTRLVPIRKTQIDYAQKFLPLIEKPRDYSKRFGNKKKKHFPDRPRVLCFHSLRHTFTTFAYRQGYNEQQVSWVTGHVSQRGKGESAKRYFHGYSVAFLSEIIESIPPLKGFE